MDGPGVANDNDAIGGRQLVPLPMDDGPGVANDNGAIDGRQLIPLPMDDGPGVANDNGAIDGRQPDKRRRGAASWSRSTWETVNVSHCFLIDGYSLVKGMGNGKHITSGSFTAGGQDWVVCFYPQGIGPRDSAYISVYIAPVGDHIAKVRALFEIVLVDQSGGGNHKVHSNFFQATKKKAGALYSEGNMWGCRRLHRIKQLETSCYLKDNCLAIGCTVGVIRNRMDAPGQTKISALPSDLGQCLKELLKSGIGSDVAFDVGGETFRAHKAILAARSPYFKAQFFGPMSHPDQVGFIVTGVEKHIFKALLHFVYTDDDHEAVSVCTNPNIVSQLLIVADLYGVERLKQICEAKLCEDIVIDNVAGAMVWAEKYCCPRLKSICLKLFTINDNLEAVMRTEGFRYLKENCPLLITDILAAISVGNESQPICGGKGAVAALMDE